MLFFIIVVLIAIVIIGVWLIWQKNKQEKKALEDKVSEEAGKDEEKKFGLGIPELVGKLYEEYIIDLPSRIQSGRQCCALITKAVELSKDYNAEGVKTKIKITLKGKEYTFSFNEHNIKTMNGKGQLRGDLELFLGEGKILALNMAKDQSRESFKWKPIYTEMFIEDNWIEDFQELEISIEQEKQK